MSFLILSLFILSPVFLENSPPPVYHTMFFFFLISNVHHKFWHCFPLVPFSFSSCFLFCLALFSKPMTGFFSRSIRSISYFEFVYSCCEGSTNLLTTPRSETALSSIKGILNMDFSKYLSLSCQVHHQFQSSCLVHGVQFFVLILEFNFDFYLATSLSFMQYCLSSSLAFKVSTYCAEVPFLH